MPPPPAPGPSVNALLLIVLPGEQGDRFFRSFDGGEIETTTHLELATAWNPYEEAEYETTIAALIALGHTPWTMVLGINTTTTTTDQRYISAARLI